jgi:DNA polymerase I
MVFVCGSFVQLAACKTRFHLPPMNETTTPKAKPTLLLVDGSSYLYRAYFALPNLRSASGFPTGAIRGVASMLMQLRQLFTFDHAACVFDAKGDTFRHEWYPAYKAQRTPMPDELVQQIEPIHNMVKLLGWPVLEVPKIEADDVLGTLAQLGAQSGYQVVISTGDKDLAQLVTPEITLLNTMSNERLDVEGVRAKFGVPPERIVDYLSLMGDTVDNVPGVAKVGPKTALKWIEEHGSLQGVMNAAASIKGAAGENLRQALDWLPQAQRLVTVLRDADLSDHLPEWPSAEALDALHFKPENKAGLLDLYEQFSFKSWKKELLERSSSQAQLSFDGEPAPAKPAALAPVKSYETILDAEAFARWLDLINHAELTAIDTETDSLNPMQARMVGISLAVKNVTDRSDTAAAAYIPLRHNGPDAPEQLNADDVLAQLKPWLQNPEKPKLGQNIKYDRHVFANEGIAVRGYVHDTLLQSYVLEAHKPHGLESLAARHLDRHGLSYEDLCGKGAHQISFAQVAVDKAAEYSCEDSDMTLAVHDVLWPQLQAHTELSSVYREIEIPVSEILGRIERHGVLVDTALLKTQSHEIGKRLLVLEQEAYDLAGQPFNLGSPKQVGEILFTRLGLPVKKKTAGGAPSTDEEVLQELAADFPLPAKLLEHRGLAKLKNTYTDKLPQMVNAQTGRIHTQYAQAVAVTGRLSSNEPNLQNIPIRTQEGRRVREAFIAPPGHVLMSADYSQIELRIMAHISGDAGLLSAFAAGLDVHRATAAEIFSISVDDVTSEQRRYAKTINFGLIYGMGAFGLASSLGIERRAADAYIERYFARYPGVKRYMENTRASAKELGYVQTLFGRRIYLPEIQGAGGPRRSGAERQAINAPMQGTAADLIKLAMIAVQKQLDDEKRATCMVMQVHDELVLEVPEAELAWAREAIPQAMAGVVQLKVPLLAEVGTGPNWDEAH